VEALEVLQHLVGLLRDSGAIRMEIIMVVVIIIITFILVIS
jgi:hypothetical protein